MKRTAFALILATVLPLAAPAFAETITILHESTFDERWNRQTGENQAERRRIMLLTERPGNHVSVDQRGNGNSVGVQQTGTNGTVMVFQRGDGATGTVVQTGDRKKTFLIQFTR